MARQLRSQPKNNGDSSDRKFGLVMAVGFVLIAVFPWIGGQSVRLWALLVAVAFVGFALVLPSKLQYPHRIWIGLGNQLHRVVSPLMLGGIFFLVITPISVLMRTMGWTFLPRRTRDASIKTYWVARNPPGPSPESFKDQF